MCLLDAAHIVFSAIFSKENAMTLRESLNAAIAKGEADLAALKQTLAGYESTANAYLDHEVEELKAFFQSVASHLGL